MLPERIDRGICCRSQVGGHPWTFAFITPINGNQGQYESYKICPVAVVMHRSIPGMSCVCRPWAFHAILALLYAW